MPTYVQLQPGQRVHVLPAGGTLGAPYESTIRHVAPVAVRVDLPRRGNEFLDLEPDAQVLIVLDQHGRLYTFTTAVQAVDLATETLVVDRPRIVEQSERRQFFRLTVSIRPRYTAVIDEAGEELRRIEALILDISGGGMRLRSKQPVSDGDRLHVVFPIRGEQLDVDVVVNSAGHTPNETPWAYHAGAHFAPQTRQLQERVIRFVFQEQVRYLKRGVA